MANDLFPLGSDKTPWRKLTDKHVGVEKFRGQEVLTVETEGLRLLAEAALLSYQEGRTVNVSEIT